MRKGGNEVAYALRRIRLQCPGNGDLQGIHDSSPRPGADQAYHRTANHLVLHRRRWTQGSQPRLNVSQTLAVSELSESHCRVLIPERETPVVTVAGIAGNTLLE